MSSDSERKATIQHKAQVIQLLPTPEQRDYFMRAAGTARYAYNWGLALWNIQYKIHKATGTAQRPNATLVWKAWSKFKKNNLPWAYEISADVPKWAIYDALPSAFKNWWNKSTPAGPPKFKSRRTARKSFVAHDKCKPEHFERRRMKLQKIGWVRCRESLRWQKLKVSRVTVSESAGKWYATVLFEDPNFTPPVHENQEAVVGVDLGSRKLAVAYNGDGYAHFDNPKALEAAQKNLRRWQRKAARRGERDKNGRVIRVTSGLRRANDRIAKLHKRIADIRRWHQHNSVELFDARLRHSRHGRPACKGHDGRPFRSRAGRRRYGRDTASDWLQVGMARWRPQSGGTVLSKFASLFRVQLQERRYRQS